MRQLLGAIRCALYGHPRLFYAEVDIQTGGGGMHFKYGRCHRCGAHFNDAWPTSP